MQMRTVIPIFTSLIMLNGCGGESAKIQESVTYAQPLHSSLTQSQSGTQPQGEKWSVSGQVFDASGQPVAQAKIYVQLGEHNYYTHSQTDGRYTLYLPREYDYPDHIAGTVWMEGYQPEILLLSYQNQHLYIDQHSHLVQLKPLTEAHVVFQQGLHLIHLGDDSLVKNPETRIQTAPQGLVWSDGFQYTQALQKQYNQLCIQLYGKGIQSQYANQDKISISRKNDLRLSITQLLSDSPSSGAYSANEHCFPLRHFQVNDHIQVQIKSHTLDTDQDNFEMLNIVGVLRKI
ncbi:carboxypeptidase-like regulatory domain-containing protein [Acinetobacter indicus]|uniref:carboxypeptidase-like regulatory domain-containing protein n=1 Tax=Acinetobacter indicus TaxID=756892 RepID=UPI0014447273|nr:carboxypeptidase-like regulatory domain-containing protein [Acinetobacter indicus]